MNNARLYEMSKKQSKSKRGKYEVILHNDDHNTVDHVIDCLMDVCDQNHLQAYQCALITHNSKKCSVFVDNHTTADMAYQELQRMGLTVELRKYEKTK
mgnify:FL=1